MRTYRGMLRYSSFVDLMRIAVANLVGVSLIFLFRHLTPADRFLVGIGWGELAVSFFLSTAAMWSVRICVKYLYDIYYVSATARRVFIYGVKEGGIALAKSIHGQESQMVVAGFVSDDPKDCSHRLMGTRIYPNDADLASTMRRQGAGVLMVSPLLTDRLRENSDMTDRLTSAGIKMLMYTRQEWDGKSALRHTQLQEVDIEDLLPRDQIDVDLEAIGRVLAGRCVLITGAAGSIGSEIVRQVAGFGPSRLVLIDQAETLSTTSGC